MLFKKYFEFWLCLFAVLLCTSILFYAGSSGWQGRADGCLVNGQCFCEIDRGGLIRQYTNTLSNLGFVFIGLTLALIVGRDRANGKTLPNNRMAQSRFYPGFYALVVCLLGPGSGALHASLTWWGSVLDLFAMNVFISFVFCYALVRWKNLGVHHFLISFIALSSTLLAIKIFHGSGSTAFGLTALASLLLEFHVRKVTQSHADTKFLWAALISFIAAFAVWSMSDNGGVLCVPESLWQGHGFWHLACAAATGFLFFYARSESPVIQNT